MRINAIFSRPAMVIAGSSEWTRSPASGVDRIMLDRIGDEVARATSIVRYAPGSQFSRHKHPEGEEFLVLEGVFSDEHGHYPAGTYVRNPPGSSHTSFSIDGCRILVKLRQFDPSDFSPVVIDTRDESLWKTKESARHPDLPLHRFGPEKVQMLRLQEGRDYTTAAGIGGIEIFVVSGSVTYVGYELVDESWLRLPAGSNLHLNANSTTTLWIKSGHLPNE